MNFKNLAMWAIIVILTIGLYNMFKNPQAAVNKNNNIIGSVGISGDTSDNDEIVAVFGIEAAEFKADIG